MSTMIDYLSRIATRVYNNAEPKDFRSRFANDVREFSGDRRFTVRFLAGGGVDSLFRYRGVKYYMYRDYPTSTVIVERIRHY